jgi:dolichol-phosphate mannosyltransferase
VSKTILNVVAQDPLNGPPENSRSADSTATVKTSGAAEQPAPAKQIACVVLPTYNEADNVKVVLPLIFGQASKIPSHDLHVVVVDDNSPDGTAAAIRERMGTFPNLHLLTGEKRGLGDAYRRGMAFALKELRADLIFQMDADLQHDPSLIPLFVVLANHGFTLVIGSRFAPGGATPGFPWHRKLISVTGTVLVRLFGGLSALSDCTSGYRCIKANVYAKCDLTGLASLGYSFQSSLLCELIRNGARVIEVPIIFQDRQRGESKLSFPDQVEFLQNLLRLRRKRRAASRFSRSAVQPVSLPLTAPAGKHDRR